MLLTKSPRIAEQHQLERFDQLLADATTQLRREAYAAGWRDALDAMRKSLGELAEPRTLGILAGVEPLPGEGGVLVSESALLDSDTHQRMPRKGSIRDCVLQTVRDNPGVRGIEIIEAVKKAGHQTTEGSVRITTFRLKEKGFIVARNRRWYPAR